MFDLRDRPWTRRLVIATLCVDWLALWVNYLGPAAPRRALMELHWNFFVPAQLTAVALWAALAPQRRLVRAAVLTAALGAAILAERWFYSSGSAAVTVAAFYGVNTLLVALGAIFLRASGAIAGPLPRSDADGNGRRVSLLELFGWTTVIALWACLMRLGQVQRIWQWDDYSFVLLNSTCVPLATAWQLHRANRLRWLGYLIFLIAATMLPFLLNLVLTAEYPRLGLGSLSLLNLMQVLAVGLWYAVDEVDQVINERKRVRRRSAEKLMQALRQQDAAR